MVFVKYPLGSLNTHTDLVAWNAKTEFNEGDWKALRDYLFQHLVRPHNIEKSYKCWYSEMYQLDPFAQDVEHYRPKKLATPISGQYKARIEKIIRYGIPQQNDTYGYPWLEFNSINYRFVTAMANRAGGKHTLFPIFQGTNRLPINSVPGASPEYPLLLDPCTEHDANLLFVLPNGAIEPKASFVPFTQEQLNYPAEHWHEAAFDFLRAWITIIVYRLDHPNLRTARRNAFEKTTGYIRNLERDLTSGYEPGIRDNMEYIKQSISSYSDFTLAARSALLSYDYNNIVNFVIFQRTKHILDQIYHDVIRKENEVN